MEIHSKGRHTAITWSSASMASPAPSIILTRQVHLRSLSIANLLQRPDRNRFGVQKLKDFCLCLRRGGEDCDTGHLTRSQLNPASTAHIPGRMFLYRQTCSPAHTE